MIRRVVFLFFMALQVATNVSPAAALLLCISDDGCASLELAAPGSTRCDEGNCDEPHAGVADHSCRDIPLFSSADDLTRANATRGTAISPLALAPAPALIVDGMLAGLAPSQPPAPPPPLRQLRSVVLTL